MSCFGSYVKFNLVLCTKRARLIKLSPMKNLSIANLFKCFLFICCANDELHMHDYSAVACFSYDDHRIFILNLNRKNKTNHSFDSSG